MMVSAVAEGTHCQISKYTRGLVNQLARITLAHDLFGSWFFDFAENFDLGLG